MESPDGGYVILLSTLELVCTLYGILCMCVHAHDVTEMFKGLSGSDLLLFAWSALAGAAYNFASLQYLYRSTVTAVDHAAFSLAKRLGVLVYAAFVDFDIQWLPHVVTMCVGQLFYY